MCYKYSNFAEVMKLNFTKYEGAGNDFILLDGRASDFQIPSTKQIEMLCHRRFGIGADGLMILAEGKDGADFSMLFYNSDGKSGSMCGNGGRCIAMYAEHLGVGSTHKTFDAPDGLHSAVVDSSAGIVHLAMSEVESVFSVDEGWFLDTGSPHVVVVDEKFDLALARKLRQKYDSNVNFIEINDNDIVIRTFERGVEDETWACGTGSVASAIVVAHLDKAVGQCSYNIEARGGKLAVAFERADDNKYSNVVLSGGARRVFSGEFEIL